MRWFAALFVLLLSVGAAQAQNCGQDNPNCIAPTAPTGANNNQIANTAWVTRAITTTATVTNSDGTITITPSASGSIIGCTTMTTSQIGCAKLDGTTITISAGRISAVGAVASQINVGSTTIGGSPTNGALFYDNAGVLGNETLATLMANPGAIGTSTPAAGTFTALTITGNTILGGTLTAASLSTVGSVAGAVCATSGGLILYESGGNCYASPTGANPTATAGASAVNGSATTFMRSDGAPPVAKATSGIFGIVEGDGSTLTLTGGVISCTTATASQIGCSQPDGTILTISGGVETVAKGTNAAFGVVEGNGTSINVSAGVVSCVTATGAQIGCAKPDGTTITVSGGVLTAIGTAAASISVGVTTVGSGTNAYLLYNNAGTLGNETFANACTNATTGASGCVKVDGTTISISSGTISTISASAGFVNKLRNSGLTDWFGGTSGITVGTGLTWTAEGVGCLETGATITASQVVNPLANPLSYYGLKLLGNTSNTDLQCRFVVESYDAAALSGQTVTFQLPILNKSGGSLTATITAKYSNTQDGWGAPLTDLSTRNLQACANNATCILSYTFPANASAYLGYEVIVDFGAISNTNYVVIGGGFDLRATPGVTYGLNNAPPPPEFRNPSDTAVWDQRFYETSYANGTAPGASTHLGMVGGSLYDLGVTSQLAPVTFKVPKASSPTMAYYDGAGASNRYSYIAAGTGTFGDGYSQSIAPLNVSVNGFICGATNTGGVNGAFYTHFTADARISGG